MAMQKIYRAIMLMTAFTLSGCSTITTEEAAIPLDAVTTAAPWKKGEIVATFTEPYGNASTYQRVFLGQTTEGYYYVQDLYVDSKQKYSDVYILKIREAVLTQQWLSGWFEAFVGDYVTWHPNGQKSISGSLLDGENHGLWTYWYDNGQKESEGMFLNGQQVGIWNYWHDNSAPKSVWAYSPDGKARVTQWYLNGQKEEEGEYKSSPWSFAPEGVWSYWYENGQKFEEGAYQAGERIGVWRTWDEKGSLMEELNYNLLKQ